VAGTEPRAQEPTDAASPPPAQVSAAGENR